MFHYINSAVWLPYACIIFILVHYCTSFTAYLNAAKISPSPKSMIRITSQFKYYNSPLVLSVCYVA